jgi:hypothetical protein
MEWPMAKQGGRAQLSRGEDIEYKAFARPFIPREGGAAVRCFYLVATCYYRESGFMIFFEPDLESTQFKLMEKSQSKIHTQLVTYHIASWTLGQALDKPPTRVTITDAHGEHQVDVGSWS